MGIRSRVTFGALLALIATATLAQNPTDCAAVKFSDDVLERFPRAQEACLDVISRGGQDYAVFNARLTEVWPSMRARLAEAMLPIERLRAALEAAGAPTTGAELGLPSAFYREAVRHAREIRDRYSILDLAGDAGLLEHFVAEEG